MKKIIAFFKRLFGVKEEVIVPVTVTPEPTKKKRKPRPKRKPKPRNDGGFPNSDNRRSPHNTK